MKNHLTDGILKETFSLLSHIETYIHNTYIRNNLQVDENDYNVKVYRALKTVEYTIWETNRKKSE